MCKLIGKLARLQDNRRAIRAFCGCHVVKREILKRGQELQLPALRAFLQKRWEALKPGIGRLCAVCIAQKLDEIFRQGKHQQDSLYLVHHMHPTEKPRSVFVGESHDDPLLEAMVLLLFMRVKGALFWVLLTFHVTYHSRLRRSPD